MLLKVVKTVVPHARRGTEVCAPRKLAAKARSTVGETGTPAGRLGQSGQGVPHRSCLAGGELTEQGIGGGVKTTWRRKAMGFHRTAPGHQPIERNVERATERYRVRQGDRLALAPATDRALVNPDLNRQGMELANPAPSQRLLKALAPVIHEQLRGCGLI
jgi:hypothetical protein